MTLATRRHRHELLPFGAADASPAAAAVRTSEPPSLKNALRPVAIFDNFWSTTLAFMTSLGRRNVPLHIYGIGAARWSRYRTRRAPCPHVDDADRFLPWLESRVRSGEIDRVAPTSDLIAYYLAVLRDTFAPEVRRTIAPLKEIEDCLIKTRFAAACGRIGQKVPMYCAAENLPDAVADAQRLGFPLVMKPRSHLVVGSMERGQIIPDLATLRRLFRAYPIAAGHESIAARYPGLCWPLLQQYVPSARTRVYSISGIKDPDGGIIVVSLSSKTHQWPPDTGISTAQITRNDPRLLAVGVEAVDRLVTRGIFELELVDRDAELLAIDLNPRAFGFLELDIAIGNDLPWLWYQSTLRPLAKLPQAARRPIVASYLRIPYLIGRCVGAFSGRERSLASAKVQNPSPERSISMLGRWSDPLPKLLSQARLLRHPGGLIRPYLQSAWRDFGR